MIIYLNAIEGIPFKRKCLNLFCLFYLLLWCLVPAFSIMTNRGVFRILFGLILTVWILTAIENLPKQLFIKVTLLMGGFLCVMGIYGFLGYGDIGFYDIINYVLLFGFALNGILYCKINSEKLDYIIITFAFLCLFLTTTTTLVGLLSNSSAARLLTSSSTNEGATKLLRSQNIGAFDFIYGLVILFPLLITTVMKAKGLVLRLVSFVLAILAVLCIIKSNFTTALLLLFLGACLPFFVLDKKNSIRNVVLVMVVTLLVRFVLPYFLEFVYSITTSILAKEKIAGVLLFMNGGSSANDVSSRVSLFELSLSSFIHNPFFGVGGYYRTTTVAYIGKHSQFVDDFARYGLLGGIPLTSFLFFSIKRCFSAEGTRPILNSPLFPSFVIFCLLGLLNPIYNYGILSSFFIIATTLARFLNREARVLNE